MALVYRASKQNFFYHQQTNLGPGSYFDKKAKKQPIRNHHFFKSKEQRFDKDYSSLEKFKTDVGPGSYNVLTKINTLNKIVTDCKSVFNSKIQRFQKNNINIQQNQKKNCSLQNLGKAFWRQQSKIVPGKIYRIKEKKQQIKSIPSIPNWSQSYGYHYDKESKELICNKNPNVLITHTKFYDEDWKKNGPGYYFIRENIKNNARKWHKQQQILKKSNLIQNLGHSQNCQKHKNNRSMAKKKWSEKGNIIVSKEERFQQKSKIIVKKDLLLIEKLKRDYKDYIDQAQPKKIIQRIEESQKKKILAGDLENLKKSNLTLQKKQCFNTKQNRFKYQELPNTYQTSKIEYQQKTISSQIDHQNKVPFGVKQKRFQEGIKSKIGPGSYLTNQQFTGTKGVTINFKQNRFSQIMKGDCSPGPCYYTVTQTNKQVKTRQKKHHQHSLLRTKMENTLLNNQEKKEPNKQQISLEKQPKVQVGFLSNVPRDCMQNIQKQDQSAQIDHHMMSHDFRHRIIPKYPKRQYPFIAPPRQQVSPGPGDFQIAKTLQTNTFNITYH